jgi:hypothetical protein
VKGWTKGKKTKMTLKDMDGKTRDMDSDFFHMLAGLEPKFDKKPIK